MLFRSPPTGDNSQPCLQSEVGNYGGASQFVRLLIKRNYSPSTKIWVCPSDKEDGDPGYALGSAYHKVVAPASDWSTVEWNNLSYFYVSKMNYRQGNKTYLLMADESWRSEGPGNTPDVDAFDNHGAAGRNTLYTDGHVQWINGPSVSNLFGEIVADYDAVGCFVQTLD